jgi:hypothetical protein
MRLPVTSRRLVVDTNVARSASESEKPVSDACRQVLQAMLQGQHRVVMSATQYWEWQKHKSPFTKRWLSQMIGKKLHVVLSPEPDSGLTDRIYALECTDKVQAEMLKDVHLLENALATDDVVLSQETNVFGLFCKYADALQIPRAVAWVNPADDVVTCVAWIRAGAEASKARYIPAGA